MKYLFLIFLLVSCTSRNSEKSPTNLGPTPIEEIPNPKTTDTPNPDGKTPSSSPNPLESRPNPIPQNTKIKIETKTQTTHKQVFTKTGAKEDFSKYQDKMTENLRFSYKKAEELSTKTAENPAKYPNRFAEILAKKNKELNAFFDTQNDIQMNFKLKYPLFFNVSKVKFRFARNKILYPKIENDLDLQNLIEAFQSLQTLVKPVDLALYSDLRDAPCCNLIKSLEELDSGKKYADYTLMQVSGAENRCWIRSSMRVILEEAFVNQKFYERLIEKIEKSGRESIPEFIIKDFNILKDTAAHWQIVVKNLKEATFAERDLLFNTQEVDDLMADYGRKIAYLATGDNELLKTHTAGDFVATRSLFQYFNITVDVMSQSGIISPVQSIILLKNQNQETVRTDRLLMYGVPDHWNLLMKTP